MDELQYEQIVEVPVSNLSAPVSGKDRQISVMNDFKMILGPILEEDRMVANIKQDFKQKMEDDQNNIHLAKAGKDTFFGRNEETPESFEDLNSQQKTFESQLGEPRTESQLNNLKTNEQLETEKSAAEPAITNEFRVDPQQVSASQVTKEETEIPVQGPQRSSFSVLLKSPSEPLPPRANQITPPEVLAPLLLGGTNDQPSNLQPPRKLSVSRSNDDLTSPPSKGQPSEPATFSKPKSPVSFGQSSRCIYPNTVTSVVRNTILQSITRHTKLLAESGARRKTGVVCPVFGSESNCVLTVEVGVNPRGPPILSLLIRVFVLANISSSAANENIAHFPHTFEGIKPQLTGEDWARLIEEMDLSTYISPVLGNHSYDELETLLEYFLLKSLKVEASDSSLVIAWVNSNPELVKIKPTENEELRMWHLYSFTYRVVLYEPRTDIIKDWFDLVFDQAVFHRLFETDIAPTQVDSHKHIITPEKRLCHVATFPKRSSDKLKLEKILADIVRGLSSRWAEIYTTSSFLNVAERQVMIKFNKDGSSIGVVAYMDISSNKEEAGFEITKLIKHISVNSATQTLFDNKTSQSVTPNFNSFEFFKLQPPNGTSKYASSNISSEYPASKIVAVRGEVMANIFGFEVAVASLVEKHYCNVCLFEMLVEALKHNSPELESMDPLLQENFMRLSLPTLQQTQPPTPAEIPESTGNDGGEVTNSDQMRIPTAFNKAGSVMSPIQPHSVGSSPFFSAGLDQLISQASSKLAAYVYNKAQHELLVKRTMYAESPDTYRTPFTVAVLKVGKKVLGVKFVLYSPYSASERGLFLPVDILQWKSIQEDSSFDGVPGLHSSTDSSSDESLPRATLNSPASLMLIESPEKLGLGRDTNEFLKTTSYRKSSRLPEHGLIESVGSPVIANATRKSRTNVKEAVTEMELAETLKQAKPFKMKSPVLDYVRSLDWTHFLELFSPVRFEVSEGVWDLRLRAPQPDNNNMDEEMKQTTRSGACFLSIHAILGEFLEEGSSVQEEEELLD